MVEGLTMAEPVQGRGASKQPPPRPETLDARQRARRDCIVQATMRLMINTDYESLQMKDITTEAGVALGTTYRYFNSKDHLVAEGLLGWSEQFARQGEPPGGRSIDRVKLGFRKAARAFEKYPCIYGHMLAVQQSTDPLAIEVYGRFAERRLDAFSSFLAKVPSPRREGIASVMSAVLVTHLRAWSLGRESIEEVYAALDEAADLLLG
jgi:TetR/AcrR family transcriptional regulator, cholesterol catabolism regulator